MSKDIPDHDCGQQPIRVFRTGFGKSKDGTQGAMYLNECGGEGTAKRDDGTIVKFSYGANGANVNVTFRSEGDEGDARFQQTYVITMKDIVFALFELNERRRATNFADAPPVQL